MTGVTGGSAQSWRLGKGSVPVTALSSFPLFSRHYYLRRGSRAVAVRRAGWVVLPAPGGRDALHVSADCPCCPGPRGLLSVASWSRSQRRAASERKGVLRASCPSPNDELGPAPRDHRLAVRKSNQGDMRPAGRAGRWQKQGTASLHPSPASGLEAKDPFPWRPALPRAPGGLPEGCGGRGEWGRLSCNTEQRGIAFRLFWF